MSASNSKIVQDVYDPMQVGSIDGTVFNTLRIMDCR